ncbi:lipocalin family protein [uncultured Psychroserpens sp.]|uniref:lipocalin family protein n=1 Tax=uncultured Psychroserpens sp. TaxID=255436 RepID=UPI00261EE579|nr:lipocalin family protein [uncultured Psychroserpens sp.]
MKKIGFLLLLTILFGCDNSEKYDLITGKWGCGSWIIDSNGKDNCKDNVEFIFSADKSYTSKIGNISDSGKFEISGAQLICYPDGKMKIGVHLDKLKIDTLQFTMSRSGQKEVMTLIRE